MQYHGKLYGKGGGIYFDTGSTSDDFDKLTDENEKFKRFLQDKLHDLKQRQRKEFIKTREYTFLTVLIREIEELIGESPIETSHNSTVFETESIVEKHVSLLADAINRQLEGRIRSKMLEIGHVFDTDSEFYDFCKSENCRVYINRKTGINHLFVDDLEIFAWDYDPKYECSTDGSVRGVLTVNTYKP